MSGKVTVSIVGENGEETVIPIKSWSMNLGGSISAASFGPGSKTWTIPSPVPQFRFGDVVRYRSLGKETYMVLTTDPENGDLLDLLALDSGRVYHDRKDPAMWEIAE